MKKKILAILICMVLIVSIIPWRPAYAVDPVSLTFEQLAAAAYALGSSMGINWGFSGSSSGSNDIMISELQRYAGTNDISFWGSEAIRAYAGKLVIPATIYTNIRAFIQNLNDNLKDFGNIDNAQIGVPVQEGSAGGTGFYWYRVVDYVTPQGQTRYNYYFCYGSNIIRSDKSYSTYYSYVLDVDSNGKLICKWRNSLGYSGTFNVNITPQVLDYSKPDYSSYDSTLFPSVLPDYNEWQGDIGAAPDTNLDQLMGEIFQDVVDNNLDVEGEIVEPAPAPTPRPTTPPAADILDGINSQIGQLDQGLNDLQNLQQGLEDLGDIAGQIDNSIGQVGDDITDAVGQSTGTISDAIETQTGALTDSAEGIADAVESLENTLIDTLDVPTDAEAASFKFDLREFFPFCIPFDIYNLLTTFDAEPVAPHVQIPFVIESLNFSYNIDLDFSVFDPVAQVLRTVEFIVYALGLAWATGKVIKW